MCPRATGPSASISSCCRRSPALPPERQRLWTYFKLWPNIAFDIYPDQIDFMQFLPVSPTETLIREIAYVHPDTRREMRAARYLNWRINRRVSLEDKALIERVQAGMASSSYTVGPLSRRRGVPAQLRAPHAQPHSRECPAAAAGAGLEPCLSAPRARAAMR